jgi:hypothetical protein
MNRSGDHHSIDDFMSEIDIDDLVDFVCDEWAELATAPSAEPVGVAETIMGTAGALTMAAFHAKDVPAGASLYTTPPDHLAVMRQALAVIERQRANMAALGGSGNATDAVIDALRAALEAGR